MGVVALAVLYSTWAVLMVMLFLSSGALRSCRRREFGVALEGQHFGDGGGQGRLAMVT
jgi:hypothetical protein